MEDDICLFPGVCYRSLNTDKLAVKETILLLFQRCRLLNYANLCVVRSIVCANLLNREIISYVLGNAIKLSWALFQQTLYYWKCSTKPYCSEAMKEFAVVESTVVEVSDQTAVGKHLNSRQSDPNKRK